MKKTRFDVFLSHNSRDKPQVRQIAEGLRDRGLKVWLDEWELPPGQVWQEALEEIIRSCRSAAVLVGKDGLGPWEAPEMRACLNQFVKRRLRIIPVLMPGAPKSVELPLFLQSFTWVDLREGITPQGLDQLEWGITRKKPGVPSGAPPEKRRLPILLSAAALLLAMVGVAAGVWLYSKRTPAVAPSVTPQAAAVVVARPSVAVLEIENPKNQPGNAWLPTALAETVTAYLGAGDQIRTVDGDQVARATAELGLEGRQLPTPEEMARLAQNLGVDHLVSGSIQLAGGPSNPLISLELSLHDARGTRTDDDSASGPASQLYELVDRAADSLRQRLQAEKITPDQKAEVTAILPPANAAESYFEGLRRFRGFDLTGALGAFTTAAELASNHPLPQIGLMLVRAAQGESLAEKAAAQRVEELSARLPRRQQLLIDARLQKARGAWDSAIDTYRSLFAVFPDDLELGLQLADTQINGDHAHEALDTLKSLTRLAPPPGQDPRIDYMRALALSRLGQHKEAAVSAERAARKARARGERILLGQAKRRQASVLQELGDDDSARTALDEAEKLFAAAGDQGGVADTLELKAFSLYRSDYDSAEKLFQRSHDIHARNGYTSAAMRCKVGLSNIWALRGQTAKAERILKEALDFYSRAGAFYEVASCLIDFGSLLQGQGDLAGAQEKYQKALEISTRSQNEQMLAIAETNLAEVLFLKGHLQESLRLHQDAYSLNVTNKDAEGQAYDLSRIARVLVAQGDLFLARQRYGQALAIQQRDTETSFAAAETKLGLAELEILENKPAQGEKLAREAEQVLRVGDSKALAAQAQTLLGEALLAQGKLPETQQALRAAEALLPQIHDPAGSFAIEILSARLHARTGGAQGAREALQRLARVAREATDKGFLLIANQASAYRTTLEQAPKPGR